MNIDIKTIPIKPSDIFFINIVGGTLSKKQLKKIRKQFEKQLGRARWHNNVIVVQGDIDTSLTLLTQCSAEHQKIKSDTTIKHTILGKEYDLGISHGKHQ